MTASYPPPEPEWCPPSLREPAGYWRTRDNRVLPITGMDTAHLKSAIALFTESGYGAEPKVNELRGELAQRGQRRDNSLERENE